MGEKNIALCDDEAPSLKILAGAITQQFRQRNLAVHIETFTGTAELKRRMKLQSFDLLFLDIDMPGTDGITFAETLREENNWIDIIYISNREDLVFEALRTQPKGFIRKSNLLQDVPGILNPYFSALPKEEKKDTMIIEEQDSIISLPISEVIYVEGSGKQQVLHLKGKKEPVVLRRQMQTLEEELSSKGFIRIHKGYLVNCRYIRRIENAQLTLTNGEVLPISRRKAAAIREMYLEQMQKRGSTML
ncbi:MAG: response regulator transcription factor [Lachnospiraceae bacterium]|nr:response regulator transcription factor [Lachnospiraceae bacterium]